MKKYLYLLLSGFALLSGELYSQCSLYPVPLFQRVNNSSLMIEGKVISQKSFWNSAGNYIYTSNLIQVNKVLKGEMSAAFVEVMTDGGEVGLRKQTVEPSLQLNPNDEGIFTLINFEQTSQFGYS